LREALESRQEIGQAIGILMERHRVTADEAFARLVFVSQRTHRKIRELAAWLIHTGEEPRILLPAARKER
jgi:AmiR/NasT family two-component response regulator